MTKKAKKAVSEAPQQAAPEMFLVRRDVLEAAIQYLAGRPFNEVANLVTTLGQSQPAPVAKPASEGQE